MTRVKAIPVVPPASPPANPRYRLQKGDMAFMVKSLSDRGFEVHTRKGIRIDAYDPVTREYLCGFSWHKGSAECPGRWTFDCTVSDVFSLKDLKIVLGELTRIQPLRKSAQTAWNQFLETKSEKRWSHYLGIVAAMFVSRASPTTQENSDG